MKRFIKEHSREYSLFRLATWYKVITKNFEKVAGKTTDECCAVYSGNDLVSVYYEESELRKIMAAGLNSFLNKTEALAKIDDFLIKFDLFKLYFSGQKQIKSVEELKQFQDKYASIWAFISMIFVIPNMPVDEDLKEAAIQARTLTQEYNESPEKVLIGFLNSQYPHIKGYERFVLPSEIWSEQVESEKIIPILKERSRGYVFYKNTVYTGAINEILNELNILLDDTESIVTGGGKVEFKNNEIKGQIANKGYAEGVVKIVSSTKDLLKVENGDILVSVMTMPKYLPAMKKAAAFVTDEGGITCHAAIVAREMNKPCIIGTKIATQVLKDGDLVEVDADNGVIKILK